MAENYTNEPPTIPHNCPNHFCVACGDALACPSDCERAKRGQLCADCR
jgi:nitrate reductase cytochrome c-type subunit